jgi:3-hydroxyisobutyrate dehydrogenase
MGVMGRAMAANIVRAGIVTSVWDRRRAQAEPLAGEGARLAPSPADAVRDADVVITMVTDADAVLEVAGQMLPAMRAGGIWAQMSTIGVDGIERAGRLVEQLRPDVTLVDAPVAGSRGPAEKGELTIFASGPAEAKAPLRPVFAAVGKGTVWVGDAGQGTRLKLVNNMLLAFQAQGLAEALGLAAELGVDLPVVLKAFDGSPLVSAWARLKLERIAGDDYSDEFSLALATKDVDLAVTQAPLPVAPHIRDLWRSEVEAGLGGFDLTVTARELRRTAGDHVRPPAESADQYRL